MADLILEIVEGNNAGQQLQLDRPLDVGRDQGMPVALTDDTQVSRRHARIALQNGVAVVEDLGSTNGTFVNDQPIHSPRQLSPGDRIRIGLTVLEVRSQQQVQQRPSAVQPRPQFTEVGNNVLAPAPAQQLGGPAPGGGGGFVPAAGAAAAAPPQAAPVAAAEPYRPAAPPPPLPGARSAAPAYQPGVGFLAAETPAGYVPAEVIGDEEAEDDYKALRHLIDPTVKQRRNVAAFALLATAGLAVVLFFGLT